MDKKTYNKAYKRLVRTFIISLLLLLSIFFLKQFIIRYQIAQETNTSYIINVAGRQRMLSQKIVKDMALIRTDELVRQDEAYKEDLESSLELWQESHQELLAFNQTPGLFEDNEEICKMFEDIEPSFTKIVDGSQDFLLGIKNDAQEISELDIYAKQVIDNEADFLDQMDAIVFRYEAEARRSVEAMQRTHSFLFLLIIMLIIFITFTIFRPLFKYVDQSFWQVNESNSNLSKLFQTMKGALFIIKRDGEILSRNADAEKIILKDQEENQGLNIETSVGWIGFDIKGLMARVKNDEIRIEDIEATVEDQEGKLISVTMSAVSGIYENNEVVVLNLFDITAQKQAEKVLKNTAMKDELTGLYNRHFLDSVLDDELERAQRYKIPFSAALLDLDYFKRVNDRWGHPVGDTVLKLTADLVKDNIRKSDFAFRIGGEEFLVLMPNTDSTGALATAEKIRQAIEDVVHPVIGNFTASFGVAQRNFDETYKLLYHRVDEALYKAKESGRNRVVLADSQGCDYVTASFTWNDIWDSGEKNIDDQHRGLFDLVSRLAQESKSTDDKEKTLNYLDHIIRDLTAHFKYEEKVQAQINYKDIVNHKKIHDNLLNKADKIRQRVKEDTLDINKAFNIIFDQIVVGHLLCEDVKFYPVLASAPSKEKIKE